MQFFLMHTNNVIMNDIDYSDNTIINFMYDIIIIIIYTEDLLLLATAKSEKRKV